MKDSSGILLDDIARLGLIQNLTALFTGLCIMTM